MKKILPLTIILLASIFLLGSAFITLHQPLFSSVPPTGRTGSAGVYCTSCHAGTLNTPGGSLIATGLPAGSYTAGTQYNFSIQINHSLADRLRWGFSIKAVNSANADVGTFTTTNPNAAPNGRELSHLNVPILGTPSSSFTFINLRWTAPTSPLPADMNITFYFVGNAANGNGANSGDFIYAATSTATLTVLPITLNSFEVSKNKTSGLLKWSTESESNTNYFAIEKSKDGISFKEVARQAAAGFSNTTRSYQFEDNSNNSGKVFYRLGMVDIDGSKSFSDIKNLNFDVVKQKLSAYPNPVLAGNNIQFDVFSSKTQMANYKIYSADNKLLSSNNVKLVSGQNVVTVNVNGSWNTGLKIARFYVDNEVQQVPFMITK